MWFNPKARLLSKLFAAKATNRKTKKQKWSKQQIQIYNITHLQTFLLNLLFVILTQEQKILIILQRFSNKRPISVQLIIKYLYLYLTYNNIVNKDLSCSNINLLTITLKFCMELLLFISVPYVVKSNE